MAGQPATTTRPASKVEDITYAWSKNATDNYGLLADIIGADEYDELTGINSYAIPCKPVSYDPTITNVTLTHERKWKEVEWDLVCTAWFICKGFLQGVIDNLRGALNETILLPAQALPNSVLQHHPSSNPQTPQ
jgi:hypothetical protein